MSRPRRRGETLGLAVLAVLAAVASRAGAQVAPDRDAPSLVSGASACPTPQQVWDRAIALVPSGQLAQRLGGLGGARPPVQVVDLGRSFRILVGERVREYPDQTRDCANRAQFAAVFIALAVGMEGGAIAPAPPAPPPVALPPPAPPTPRARLDLGATLAAGLGSGDVTVAPGLTVRAGLGRRRLLPAAGVTVLLPIDTTLSGVAVRQWRATADLDLRAPAARIGKLDPYVELGAAVELIADRPLDLAAGRSQLSYAVGPRVAGGVVLVTASRFSPFLLVDAAWFPGAPEIVALPYGQLGHAPVFTLTATAGVSWRRL